jgi:hypothetical protein
VIRTLDTTPRTATEVFWISEHDEPEPWWNPESVVGERDIAGPMDGPVLVWDERVGDEAEITTLLEGYFAGNLAAWSPPERTERNTAGLGVVSDDEFWAVIEVLNVTTREKTIDAAARSLAERDEDFVLRWHETLSLKAVALDEAIGAANLYDAGQSMALHLLGATIARGPDIYAAVLADPEAFDATWLNDASSLVLFIGAFALHRKVGGDVAVTTSFTPVHERILRAWDAEARQRDEHRLRLSPNPDSLRERVFHLGRALVVLDHGVHLRVIIAEDQPGAEDNRPGLRVALEAFGGRVCSPVETSEGGWSGIGGGPVLVVKRRFSGTREEYLARFVQPER